MQSIGQGETGLNERSKVTERICRTGAKSFIFGMVDGRDLFRLTNAENGCGLDCVYLREKRMSLRGALIEIPAGERSLGSAGSYTKNDSGWMKKNNFARLAASRSQS